MPLPESYARYQLKIEAPRQPSTTVDRPRLLTSSTERARLVLLIAPAGFGKTTLLTQWRTAAIEVGQVAAWLTLDDADADPKVVEQVLLLLQELIDQPAADVTGAGDENVELFIGGLEEF